MKKLLISSVVAVLFMGASGAYAVDEHHPEQQNQTPTKPAGADKAIQKLEANTKSMQTLLGRIHNAKDQKERQKLMMEYMQTMHENMMLGRSMMHGMMDCTMMKGGMMGEGGASPDAMMDRMNRMEKRMDMMQMMMEQMTKSQTPPAK